MPLGLGASLSKASIVTPGVVTDNLVMKHMYPAGAVQPISDGAVYCDGSTYVDCGTGIGTALGDNYAGDLTVSMWFKANATTGVGLFQSGNESHNNREFSLRLNSDTIEFGLNNIGWQRTVAFTDTSNWHHVTAVLDNGSESTSLLYLDGVSVGSVAGGSSFPTASNLDFNGDDTHIGRFYNSEFNGYICNVGMWTRILTQAEIKSIMWKQYADLTTSEKTNLVSWWNLDSSETASDGKVITYDNHYGGSASSVGSELLTNGDFATGDLTGWTTFTAGDGVEASYVNGGARIYSPSGGNTGIRQAILTTGKLYDITYTIIENNGGSLAFEDETTDTITSTVGTHTIKNHFVDSDSNFIIKRNSGATDIIVGDISVKEVQGNWGVLS